MPRRTTPSTRGRTAPQPEPEDSYPHIPEPKQAHGGTLLASLSVLAILAFGAWTAIGTLTAPAGKAAAKPQVQTTVAPASTAGASGPAAAPGATSAPSATQAPAQATASPAGAAAAAATAPARASTPGPGGTRVYVVGQGDTLYRIASLYGTTVDAIMAANGFTDRSKVLHVGDKLKIP